MRNIIRENNRYSRSSSSDTYEKLKRNKKYKLKDANSYTNDLSEGKIIINNENTHKTENKIEDYKDKRKEKIKKKDEEKHKKYKLKINKKEKAKRMEKNTDKKGIKNDKNDEKAKKKE